MMQMRINLTRSGDPESGSLNLARETSSNKSNQGQSEKPDRQYCVWVAMFVGSLRLMILNSRLILTYLCPVA